MALEMQLSVTDLAQGRMQLVQPWDRRLDLGKQVLTHGLLENEQLTGSLRRGIAINNWCVFQACHWTQRLPCLAHPLPCVYASLAPRLA